ncbi:DUF2254 domain-containing protein [Marinicella rhabdoformis]|uniref:DUF2254 domain-containing protein n=1 Tax=Marinicella rhabdoformis TaxID=2580566 RepID=UPI0012AEDE22|nr:DUF2254 domain-containing protein [Marinicella rhabdoformis]
MKKIIDPIYFLFLKLKNKLAFFPALMATWGVLFGLFMIYLEQHDISSYLQKYVPALVISDLETARTILTTFVAGLISIMVFSFSMVMILLNQAASNFSPRLLPGLISNKKHQFILGIYLMGIFYCLIVLISIEPKDLDYQLPGFSVLLSIFIMATSLAAFIFFVHSISQSIQVANILKSMFCRAELRLKQLTDESLALSQNCKAYGDLKVDDQWTPYCADKTGFIQTYDQDGLCELCEQYDTQIYIPPNKNTFLLSNLPVFKSKKKLSDEQAKAILNQIIIDDTEPLDNNYVLTFKLITEIAVKAMSPGINDPGTAVTCIDYITQLLSIRMKKPDASFFSKNDVIKVQVNNITFDDLVYLIFAPLRAYCSHDVILVTKLLKSIRYLLSVPSQDISYHSSLRAQAKLIIHDSQQALSNPSDLELILQLEQQLDPKQ